MGVGLEIDIYTYKAFYIYYIASNSVSFYFLKYSKKYQQPLDNYANAMYNKYKGGEKMKDRIEIRLTVATGKMDATALKALKPAVKLITPYLERIAEAATKVIESESAKDVRENDKY